MLILIDRGPARSIGHAGPEAIEAVVMIDQAPVPTPSGASGQAGTTAVRPDKTVGALVHPAEQHERLCDTRSGHRSVRSRGTGPGAGPRPQGGEGRRTNQLPEQGNIIRVVRGVSRIHQLAEAADFEARADQSRLDRAMRTPRQFVWNGHVDDEARRAKLCSNRNASLAIQGSGQGGSSR
jgi:hypothetical protein